MEQKSNTIVLSSFIEKAFEIVKRQKKNLSLNKGNTVTGKVQLNCNSQAALIPWERPTVSDQLEMKQRLTTGSLPNLKTVLFWFFNHFIFTIEAKVIRKGKPAEHGLHKNSHIQNSNYFGCELFSWRQNDEMH